MSPNRPGNAFFVSSFRHVMRGIVRAMERNHAHGTGEGGRDAVIEALLAPAGGSFVDALLALADEAADGTRPDSGRQALHGGFQAALARRMRAAITRESGLRDAA